MPMYHPKMATVSPNYIPSSPLRADRAIPIEGPIPFQTMDLEEFRKLPTPDELDNILRQDFTMKFVLPPGHLIYAIPKGLVWEVKKGYIKHRTTRRWSFSAMSIAHGSTSLYATWKKLFKATHNPLIITVNPATYNGYSYIILPPWHGKDVSQFRKTWNVIDNPAF